MVKFNDFIDIVNCMKSVVLSVSDSSDSIKSLFENLNIRDSF